MYGTRTNSARPTTSASADIPGQRCRRLIFTLLVLSSTVLGAWAMFQILHVGGITPLQGVILVLFTITFTWIVIAFWTALIGFILQLAQRDPLTLSRRDAESRSAPPDDHRTALVMPIFNEDPQRVVSGLEQTCRSLLDESVTAGNFEAFILSDTTDAEIARQEETAVAALQQRFEGRMAVHYRRREFNHGRKAGNLAEFCRRWGQRYEFLVVLDADSIMGGRTLVSLVRAMQDSPRTGLIQTVPIPIRQNTIFGRFQQFAAALYSPMLATGQSFWQGDAANYWGHNAILRTRAFMACCGLPELSGRPPLGGEILSHDFVEAALMRRAGWQVRLDTAIVDSFEEMPGNLLDFAKRDRRWTQGNLQHLRLLGGRGLHTMSRLHFLFGALAYVSSVLWGLMLAVSTVEAVGRALNTHRFFSDSYQLFPNWPLPTPGLVLPLLAITIALLLLPKVLGILLAWGQRPAAFGGKARLLASALLEIVFAVLIAPIMMAFHSLFVLGVLSGYNVTWSPQVREGRTVPWRKALRHTWAAILIGAIWAGSTYELAPMFFWWLVPVWAGLLLSAWLVRITSSLRLGRRLRQAGLLLVPSEVSPPRVLQELEAPLPIAEVARLMPPPPEAPGEMPVQSFTNFTRHAMRPLANASVKE
ncbi:glucans biosynthesis glucosyltransferase MdoH [Litchfieldella rifensis]|uniref:Glucans biosynthesis glucosyltransferase H n=1 Tax=Litchfieldella rifensis TaxID=762643 RepID=A0ABV7LJE0_9GAMM